MSWQWSSSVGHVPDDPVGEAVAESIAEMLRWSSVELRYSPDDAPPPPPLDEPATARLGLELAYRSIASPVLPPSGPSLTRAPGAPS
jgi:hypothetical protein